jgi:hypothetical protein
VLDGAERRRSPHIGDLGDRLPVRHLAVRGVTCGHVMVPSAVCREVLSVDPDVPGMILTWWMAAKLFGGSQRDVK